MISKYSTDLLYIYWFLFSLLWISGFEVEERALGQGLGIILYFPFSSTPSPHNPPQKLSQLGMISPKYRGIPTWSGVGGGGS